MKRVSLVIMDVDGVLSDGKIILRDDAFENKHFNCKDGSGIYLGRKMGLTFAVISGRDTPSVRRRFSEQLKIDDVFLGKSDKSIVVDEILSRYSLTKNEYAFIGDDFIDAHAMRDAGVSFAPADACPEIRGLADYVTRAKGGEGVVREAVMLLLKAKGCYRDAIAAYGL